MGPTRFCPFPSLLAPVLEPSRGGQVFTRGLADPLPHPGYSSGRTLPTFSQPPPTPSKSYATAPFGGGFFLPHAVSWSYQFMTVGKIRLKLRSGLSDDC